ncbi:hypothetical protein BGV67_27825 [Burkholderia ubonensis]|nr:hypothetical protein WL03_12360 [Burkholderia ubonensis]KWC46194.1 hypothetical protein WL52_19560 [Burkholderia ubonensis]OJA43092.1 hypothetical protein BGV67_27825 [Burkholderia ubonensis]OJA84929.1 hypothetical protein BGV49_20460 [Burkholderia ubonensis]
MKMKWAGCFVILMNFAAQPSHADEIYGGVATDGIGLGYGHAVTRYANLRTEFDGFALSRSFNAGDLRYDAHLDLYHGGLYADLFPAPSVVPFHLTAGLIIGGDNIDATATSMTGTYRINGVTVPTGGETIHAKAKFPVVRPYFGLGFGHNPSHRGLSAFFDAGVAFGKPHVDFDVPPNIVAAAGQSNVDAEEANLRDKANRLRFYPIVKIGATYRF